MSDRELRDLGKGLGLTPLEEQPHFENLDEYARAVVQGAAEWAREILTQYSLPPDCGLSHATGLSRTQVPNSPLQPRPIGPPSQFQEESKEWFAASIIEQIEDLSEALWTGDISTILLASIRIGEVIERARHKFKDDLRLQHLHEGRKAGSAAVSRNYKARRAEVIQLAREIKQRDPLNAGNDSDWARRIRSELTSQRKPAETTIRKYLREARAEGLL